jgi:hypothetical protein
MAQFSTTSDNLDQTDEDILTYTISDEAIEAAAGIWRGAQSFDCGSVNLPIPITCWERKPMDDPNTTTGTFESDEDVLTYRCQMRRSKLPRANALVKSDYRRRLLLLVVLLE